jgi:alpha-amylase/alpha-mannosidase (GH57 family)
VRRGAASSRSIVLHGHFYQPPREDPWTEEVPAQPTAAPFHDWNERIEAECYRPITESRVLDEDDSLREVVNCLEWMSFDFGPTLMWWLERHAPDTYAAVLDADRRSVERLGRGNAMAMAYHHPILPLSDARDRRTEIRWGIADFRRRFDREPEGMWLPETAVDDATLDALAAEGIRFTVLAPHQVDPVPDDGRPVRYVTANGREIALFVYDGALSHGVAFGGLLRDGVGWAERMAEGESAALRSVATDGETFGHHHEFAEMALARAITELRARPTIRVDNYAAFLARAGAHAEATLVAPSAWSCAHGVERWRSDCGCRADFGAESSQAWRGPLRAALEWLANELHDLFERDGTPLLGDPWAARDAYGAVVGVVEDDERRSFVRGWVETAGAGRGTDLDRALGLLEMERNALRLFTSCAWFFDDVGGLEPRQVLLYAARALQLAGPDGARIRPGFVKRLRAAVSNDPEVGTAADVFEEIGAPGPGGRAARADADGVVAS